MSGICGIYCLDGTPVEEPKLADMVQELARRGPDGRGLWREGAVGLGHTLLWTLPESSPGRLPCLCAQSGCVITGDVRLDNRDQLLASLGSERRERCDEQLVLDAYLAWGESCVSRLQGDFAFVVWNPRQHRLFGARDRVGVRPFYYHHSARRLFAFASQPRSILALPQVSDRLNEGRIADFLVSQLEGIDKTSTFFDQVFRLPPAHCVRVSPDGVRIWRYWTLEPDEACRRLSLEASAELLRERLTEAVRCRLRSRGPAGSMLSGGMDSGAIVALASPLFRNVGAGPLPTFSAVARDEANCVESQAIRAALAMPGLDPCLVHPGQLADFQPDLDQLTWNLEEPFDNHMTLPRVLYLAARQRGLKVLLDGIDGDTVLSEGHHLARLVRRGRWLRAYAETRALTKFRGAAVRPSPLRDFVGHLRLAFVPRWLRRLRRRWAQEKRVWRNIRESFISPELARRIDLGGRLDELDRQRPDYLLSDAGRERALAMEHSYVTVAVERYGRVAAAAGLEPRHPFLDPRVMAFCAGMPEEHKLRQGWPKFILRQAMAERLPEAVRWRRGKEHLGSEFTLAYASACLAAERFPVDRTAASDILRGYAKLDERNAWDAGAIQSVQFDNLYDVAHLSLWLASQASRSRFGDEVSR